MKGFALKKRLAKIRKHASWVHFAKIHFGKIHFGKTDFGKIDFGKIHVYTFEEHCCHHTFSSITASLQPNPRSMLNRNPRQPKFRQNMFEGSL